MEAGDEQKQHDTFPPTRWSLVLDAGEDDPVARATFCHAYWFPLYCYARRTGKGVQDAEDLTQAFFERMLSRDFLAQANSNRGRLRTFLLRCFANFMTEQWRRDTMQKRGAGKPALAIDAMSAEERLALEPHDTTTPELEFERAWARELLRQAVERLEAAYRTAGNSAVFHALRDHLTDGSGETGYDRIASGLGISEPAARFAAFKLRQRYRQTLRDLIRDTVANLDEVESEVTHLRALF
jgi:RNA polymerase sigma factor (sigma-70 family)